MKNNLKIQINNPKIGDTRSFEEYEKIITYEWIKDLNLIKDIIPQKDYVINGSYDEEGNIAILLYGHNESIEDFQGQGFEMTNIEVDKRLLESGELDEIWIPSFISMIQQMTDGVCMNENGDIMRMTNGEAVYKQKYDYFWFKLNRDDKTVLNINGFKTMINKKERYYIKWLK